MSDDPSRRGKADRIRINIKQVHERSYWCAKFGITRPTLQLAVKTVGPMVKDVKRWLIERIEKS